MDKPNLRARLGAMVVPALFFGSGASALAYEVLWERSLRLSFGISTYSVAIVTGAFMAGLSAGYALGRARWLRGFHPLRVYAVAEAAVALYAIAFPALHRAVDALYAASGGSLAIRTILSVALLLLPTACMGATLPVVSRWLSEFTSIGRAAAALLAANTTGGVFATLATGWFWIRLYGAASTNEIAIAINLAVAVAAFGVSVLHPWRGEGEAPVEPPSRPHQGSAAASPSPGRGRVLAAAAFAVGFQTMAVQVVWNRTLVCVVENNTTSFSLILASVLLGSAIGAFLYLLAAPRFTDPPRAVRLFFRVEWFLCVAVVGSIPLLNRLYDVERSVSALWPVRIVLDLCLVRWSVAMLPVVPASAAGAFLVPLLIEACAARDRRDGAAAVSAVLAADALGSLAGSLAGAFLMIPLLGLGRSLIAVGMLALVTGLGLRLAVDRRGKTLAFTLAAATAALAFWVGPLTLTRWYEGHQGVRGELLYYHEGISGTISVFRVDDRKELLINCIEEVPNHRDAMLLFKLLGHTALLLHPEPRSVLVNALGGGITLGAVLQHEVEVEAVELVPEVREAMRLFADENNNAANRTDWRLIADDGRNYLRLSGRRYDVITADATHPAAGESWPLYTREYYRIVRSHLQPNGIFAQWLPLHNLVADDFLGTMRTFRSVFPEMLVLFANRYCVLIGAEAPIALDPAALTGKIRSHERISADLAPYGIDSGPDLLKYVVLDAAGVDRLTADAEILTDDRASVEFAELRRIGIADTFPLDLVRLAGALDPSALARRTGLPAAVFEARKDLLEAQLARREPTLEATFEALVKLDAARSLAPHDQDVEIATETMQRELLSMVVRDYAKILERPDLDRYTDIFHYARELHPDDPFLNQVLGAMLLKLRRWDDAATYLERSANERPDDVNYQSNLAFAYEQGGRYAQALEVIGRLQALEPGNPAFARVKERIEQRLKEKGKGS